MRNHQPDMFANAFAWVISTASLLMFASCQKDVQDKIRRLKPEVVLSDKSGNGQVRIPVITLSKDTVYILTSDFVRQSGEQMIIEAGTLIKAVPDVGITIEPGAFISANGTSADPIIFTSSLPAGSRGSGWRGLIIRGKSSNNQTGSTGDPNDNSGSLRYVRLEFASLTLESVGKGTILESIQVSYAPERTSFELNGGTADMKYLVSYACGGPADFYITNGYQGRLQFMLAHRHPFFGKAAQRPSGVISGLYIENNESGSLRAEPLTRPLISNLSVIGPDRQLGMTDAYGDSSVGFYAASLVINYGANLQLRNAALMGFPLAAFAVADSNAARNLNFANTGTAVISSVFASDDSTRAFLLRGGIYRNFDSRDFKVFMQDPSRNNRLLHRTGDFMLKDPFNYNAPDPMPSDGSILLQGANFSGSDFAEPFFDKVSFKGAFGLVNWMDNWVNFTPLRTNYNRP